MNNFAVARKQLPFLLSQARSLLVLIGIGVVVLLVVQTFLSQGAGRTGELLQTNSALRTIEVDSSSPNGNPTPLSSANIDKIRSLSGVKQASVWLQQGVQISDQRMPGDVGASTVFWATPRIDAIQPAVTRWAKPGKQSIGPDEVILPSHINGKSLAGLLGTTLPVSYTAKTGPDSGESRQLSMTVAGLYDETLQGLDGPTAIYVPLDTVIQLSAARDGGNTADYSTTFVYPKLFVEAQSLGAVTSVQRLLTDGGFAATSSLSRSDSLPGAVQFLRALSGAVAVLLGIFCLGCGLSIGSSLARSRKREIGLFRALGWSRQGLGSLFAIELGSLGLVAGAVGTIVGVAVSALAGSMLQGTTTFGLTFSAQLAFPSWQWILLAIFVPMLGLLIGAILPLIRAVRIDADDALRS